MHTHTYIYIYIYVCIYKPHSQFHKHQSLILKSFLYNHRGISPSIMSSSSFIHSRRFLLHPPLPTATPTPPTPPPPSAVSSATSGQNSNSSSSSEQYPGDSSFDANVVMVLSVLLCALICSLGLNSIIRCALRCSSFVSTSSSSTESRSDSGSAQSSAASNTGVKKKALKTFPTVNFSADLNLPGLDGECAICLSEFVASDRLRLLPKCNHGFHARCIDKWLNSHSSCPKCRQNLLETCQKIVGSSSEQVPTAIRDSPAVVLAVSPLEPEGPIRSFRGNS